MKTVIIKVLSSTVVAGERAEKDAVVPCSENEARMLVNFKKAEQLEGADAEKALAEAAEAAKASAAEALLARIDDAESAVEGAIAHYEGLCSEYVELTGEELPEKEPAKEPVKEPEKEPAKDKAKAGK